MAGLHDKILKTLTEAGSAGLSVDALKKRLHPIYPPAIAGGVSRLAKQGKVEELPTGNFRALGEDNSEERPAPRIRGLKPKDDDASPWSKSTPGGRKGTSSKRDRGAKPEPRSSKGSSSRSGGSSRNSRDTWEGPTLEGRLATHRDGFGFVTPSTGNFTKDIFVPPGCLGGAFPGDLVEVQLAEQPERPDGRMKGRVIGVSERARTHLAGFLEEIGPRRYLVMPTDPSVAEPLPVLGTKVGKAKPGDIVLARLVEQEDGSLAGKVEEVLGAEGDPGLDTQMLIHENGIRHEWPEAVLAAAKDIPQEIEESEVVHRVDLRDQPCYTIDGKDSRDLDDAIYIEDGPKGGFRLWVHIADVSHYVRPGDTIDVEAITRGTSVYFPDRVIPMLPVGLSNGICSLNPDVDRFALTARMDFSKTGKRQGFKLLSTVIRSHHRLNYEDVHNAAIEKDPKTMKRLKAVLPDLERAFQLSDALKKQRNAAGYIDFHLPEVHVKVNELGEPIDISPKPENRAYGLIEQFMVSANEAVSDWMVEGERDFVFRVHEFPDPTKLADLAATAQNFGVKIGKIAVENPAPMLQEFLAAIDGRPDQDTLRIMTLRCMKLAEYTPNNKGHFGLGSKAYTHFTSPIRRYPDLIVHRLLKDRAKILNLGKKRRNELVEALGDLCRECSRLERQAEGAEREAIRLKKLHFLNANREETFSARVNGVAHFGLFMELDGIGAEGLIHISQVGNEYFHFDEEAKELVGNESGQIYRMGTRMTVRIEGINLRERRAMLVPATGEATFRQDAFPAEPKRKGSAPDKKRTSKRATPSKKAAAPAKDSGTGRAPKKGKAKKSAAAPARKSGKKTAAKKAPPGRKGASKAAGAAEGTTGARKKPQRTPRKRRKTRS